MSIHISLDAAEAQRVIDALPSTIFKAQRSAIGTTTTWANKEMQSRMAIKTGIPARVFRRFRVVSKRQRDSGLVWVGLNKVKAAYVGDLLEEIGGASAGNYYFEGGFIATMRSGHEGIFKRLGQGRLKIIEQTVNLNLGFEVAEEVAGDAGRELRARFAAKVLELNPHLQ